MTQQQEQAQPQQNNSSLQGAQNLTNQEIKGIIEALLFATQRPLSAKDIKDIIEVEDVKLIRDIIDEIKKEYIEQNKSFKLAELAGGFQFTTDPVYAKWLRKLYKISKRDYLTKPGLETLSVIAYKQPVTKVEIEFVRGVNVDGVIKSLMQRGLIRISGRKKIPGNPFLYSTTRFFLQYFGLNSLDDLPKLPEFQEADIQIGDELLVENLPENNEPEHNQDGGSQNETEDPTTENR